LSGNGVDSVFGTLSRFENPETDAMNVPQVDAAQDRCSVPGVPKKSCGSKSFGTPFWRSPPIGPRSADSPVIAIDGVIAPPERSAFRIMSSGSTVGLSSNISLSAMSEANTLAAFACAFRYVE
jgi:hypothetical protein